MAFGYSGTAIAAQSRGETHFVITRTAELTLAYETTLKVADVREMGAIIAPPVPAFYAKPQTLEDMIDLISRSAVFSTSSPLPDQRSDGGAKISI